MVARIEEIPNKDSSVEISTLRTPAHPTFRSLNGRPRRAQTDRETCGAQAVVVAVVV